MTRIARKSICYGGGWWITPLECQNEHGRHMRFKVTKLAEDGRHAERDKCAEFFTRPKAERFIREGQAAQ